MKTKLFTLLLAVAAGVGTILASDTQVDSIWYDFDTSTKTASVTYHGSSDYSYSNEYSGDIVIPASVVYNAETYSVTSIGENAFRSCYGLTSVTIPNSVTSIGENAFRGCTGLTSVTIPNSVTSIGDCAFYHVNNVVYSGSATGSPWGAKSVNGYVDGYFVYSDAAKTNLLACSSAANGDIVIPNTVKSIENDAFSGCSGLTSVTIPNSVTSIGDFAFYGCTGLTSITIPNSVTSIGSGAFSWCTSLTSVTIPNSVTSIGKSAFYLVANIVYNGAATGSPWGARNVNGYVEGNLVYSDAAKTNLLACSSAANGDIVIPNTVKSIGENAFRSCYGLTSVTIPNSVTSIGDDAFRDCSGLTSVTIPNSVTSIGSSAFSGCTRLASITIPNSVTSIGLSAFYACRSLTSVTIPNSATSIGGSAFYGCYGLTSITCEAATPPTCDLYVFGGVAKSIPLYVPFGSEDAYRNATEWKDFTNIQPIKADNVDITTTEVVPDETSVNIAWPKVSGAASYELVIKDKNGKVVCTLVFDAEGRLLSIAFNAPARDNMPQQTHVVGFAFTVTGLNSGTTYNYSIASKDNNGNTLNTESGSFKTTGESTGLQNVTDQLYETKFFRNGQLFIQRDGKTYSVTGQEVK